MSELPRHLNGKTLAGRYARLGPEERFRLALEAGARDDDRERERLVQSAPTCRSQGPDSAYMDRIEASRELALAVALDLGPRIVALRLPTAIPGVFAGALAVGATVWAEADDAEEAAVKETVRELPTMQACP